jgi:PAS domain S-box-containing protein
MRDKDMDLVRERSRNEAHLRAILDNAADAIISVDPDGLIGTFNVSAEAMFGHPTHAVLGRDIRTLLSGEPNPDSDPFPGRGADDAGGVATAGPRAVRAMRHDGSAFPAELTVGEVRTDEEHVFVGIVRDVSDRQRAEDMEGQLRQAQKMEAVGRLTGGVAHDFNNLLTVIIGNLQLLQRSLSDDADVRRRLDAIMGAARSGAELTRRLLTFSRQQVLETGTVDVNELVLEMREMLHRTVGENIAVRTAVSGETCFGHTDRHQLEHALLNLCVNARDAMPDGGNLTIETRHTLVDDAYAATRTELKPGRYVEIAVSDSGIGIPPEICEKIFEPFFTTKEKGKGTGLGLSTVFGFMKQSGGHVSVYSEVGHGTTFKLLVPEAKGERAAAAAAAPDNSPPVDRHHRGTVLVVEDEEAVRQIAVTMLASAGFDIVEASTGRSGLEAFARHPGIDAVFSDVIMPGGMTGPEMVKAIRQSRPEIPVLFASGYAEHALRDRDAMLEHARFIAKPYDVERLPGHIGSLLEGVRK